jgi:hypothetical protein
MSFNIEICLDIMDRGGKKLMTITRWQCAVLAFIMILAGPYATWLSVAQAQQTQTATMDTSGSILNPPLSGSVEPTAGDAVAAGFMNVVYVPGKAILCGLGTVATVGLLLVTFGTAYRPATAVFKEGCAGDWVLTPEHISGAIPPQSDVD